MKLSSKLIFFLIFIVIFANIALAQNTTEEKQLFIENSLSNIQQVGNFYFINLPENGYFNQQEPTPFSAKQKQIILTIMAEFEKRKNVSIIHFQIIRDQRANSAGAFVDSIVLKAIPNK